MKRRKMWMVVVVAVILGGGYYWWRGSQSSTGVAQYVTALVEKGTITMSVSGSGNVVVDQQATIDPTISGTVANLSVSVGDSVKKGEFLFTIVNDQLNVSLASARASLKQAENLVVSANISKDQARDAYKTRTGDALNKNILKQKIAAAREAIVAAEQSLAVSRLSYQKALDDTAKRRVVSPIDGTVNAVNIRNGDDLSKLSSGSSRTVPIIIGDLSTMKAQVQINEVDVSNVMLGQKATMTFSAIPELMVSGKVEKIDSLGTITQGVVIYNATIGFDTLDPRIKSGMSVTASVITGVRQDVVVVPNSAVKTSNGVASVQVMREGQATPEAVPVQVGVANNTDTEIASGVNVGDAVVTRTINPNAATTTATSSAGAGGLRLPGLGGGAGGTTRRGD